MKSTQKEKKNILINRIENNYYAFKYSLNGISREKLIKMAGRIVLTDNNNVQKYKQFSEYCTKAVLRQILHK